MPFIPEPHRQPMSPFEWLLLVALIAVLVIAAAVQV